MKVSFLQYDVKHCQEENLQQVEQLLLGIDTDLVVLPELSNCGYLFESRQALEQVAQTVPGGTWETAINNLAKKYDCTIISGVAEREEHHIYNTAIVAHKGKYVGKYRKIHLSDFEKRFFEPGNENNVFEIDGVKIGVQICFDLWFPEISREQIRQGANILCALANFGGETTYHIAQTRAVENLTPLVLCNRIGHEKLPDMDAYFCGRSCVIDASGKRIVIGEEGTVTGQACEITPFKMRSNVICKNFDEEIERHYS